jgi:hypothetical protein
MDTLASYDAWLVNCMLQNDDVRTHVMIMHSVSALKNFLSPSGDGIVDERNRESWLLRTSAETVFKLLERYLMNVVGSR